MLLLYLVLQRGKIIFSGNALLILLYIWITSINASQGTIRTPASSTYIAMIILAGLFFKWRGILIASIASSLAIAGLIAAENAGLLPTPNYSNSCLQWFAYTFLFASTASLAFYVIRIIQKSLARTRREVEERKKIEEKLRKNELKYRTVADNTRDWEFWQSPEGTFIYTSPSCINITGHSPEEFASQPKLIEDIIHPKDLAWFQSHIHYSTKNKVVGEIEFRVIQPNGNIVWVSHVCQPVFDENGTYLGIRGSNRDIEQALHDPLTNLYNRRHLTETLEKEISRTQRERKYASVVIMDIDRFKKVNDTYGHQTGDKFLISIADLLKKNIRDSDFAYRYGGEEFLLILPGTTASSAFKRADHFRQLCAGIRIPYENRELSITLSIGVAACPTHGKKADELLIKADKALYQSKHDGRNRVTIWKKDSVSK
ncbi:MAG: sensor domain-containing diguanylate cyclase [Anaerolineales bacterium]|nr:sensor domain-containing diguanylate cyclase [Anaerolineales bacterium]